MPFTHPGESVGVARLRARDAPRWRARMSCTIWGHHVDNHVFRETGDAARRCRCGDRYLRTDGSDTRVRHTLSCFLGHHTYVRMADRDGHHEYVCVQCGHPLLFAATADPYASAGLFKKKVRYLCGLFGHHVHRVTSRKGFEEHACHCGHSFLKDSQPRLVIRHPLVCVVAGHFVRFVTARAGYDEYVCRNCGHPFCFAQPRER